VPTPLGLPRVSIIIPTYNSGQVLLESVRSALGQTYAACEVIVIDDGSTDDTAERLEPFLPSIRYLRQENGGLASARNAGHRLAQGDYIAWLDADDIAHPDRVLIQASYLSQNPQVAVIASEFRAFNQNGLVAQAYCRNYYGLQESLQTLFTRREDFQAGEASVPVFSGEISKRLLLGNLLHPPTVMTRRSAVLAAGELDCRVASSEDWCYLVTLSRLGEVAFVDKPLLDYRLSDSQMTSPKKAKTLAIARLNAMDKIAREHPDLASRMVRELQRLRARANADAADAFCEEEPRVAISHLLASLRDGYFSARQLRTVAKLMLPRFALEAYRARKKREEASSATESISTAPESASGH